MLAVRPARQADDGPGDRAARPGAAGSPGLLVRALPYLTVVIAAFAPLAAGIYLLTTLAWSLAERMLYSRRRKAGPLSAPTTVPRPEVPSGAAQLTVGPDAADRVGGMTDSYLDRVPRRRTRSR